jgi:hypothetical protein
MPPWCPVAVAQSGSKVPTEVEQVTEPMYG